MRTETRAAEVTAFIRDRDAAAKALDPVAFERGFLPRATENGSEMREHLLGRRLSARRKATIVMQALTDRGWRRPAEGA